MISVIGTVVTGLGVFSSVPSFLLVGLTAVVAGIAIVGILGSTRPSGFPPGPTPIPFVGNITSIRKDGHPIWVNMGKLGKEYGEVFSIKLGEKWYVVLNSYRVIREGMAAGTVALANRPHYYSTDLFSEDYRDLAYTDYSPTWVLHRQFALNAYSDVYSNKHIDAAVNQQFTRYVEPVLASIGGEQSVDGIGLGNEMAMGSVVTWCFGPGNEQFHRDLVAVICVEVSLNLVGRRIPVDIFPFLRYLPLPSNRDMRDVVDRFMTMLRTEFSRRRQTVQGGDKSTDLCGALLLAQKAVENEEKYDFLTDVHVIQVLASSFRGSIGLLTTMHWGLALLAEYPDVQQRAADEIRDVIGKVRQPSVGDRDAMPYTVAMVMEMLRFGSVAALGVPRAAHEDVEIGGFNIPKGTVILYNIYGTHFDEANYASPHEFNPDRFLSPDGSVVVSPDNFIPFGLGTRKCLGYVLAQSVLLLAFSRLLQGYRVGKPTGPAGHGSLLAQHPGYEGSRWPKPFDVTITKR